MLNVVKYALPAIILIPYIAFSQDKPRIFITESNSWQITAFSGGGARPQNAEIAKTFSERCPDVTVNIRQDAADYIVQLEHEGGKGVGAKDNKVSVFKKNGDLLYAGSTAVLGNSVKDSCAALLSDWRRTTKSPSSSIDPNIPAVSVSMIRTSSHARLSEAAIAYDVLDTVIQYLEMRGVNVVDEHTQAAFSLIVTVDRPIMKWLKVSVEAKTAEGKILWQDKAESGGGLNGAHGLRVAKERLHKLLDLKIGVENGLPGSTLSTSLP